MDPLGGRLLKPSLPLLLCVSALPAWASCSVTQIFPRSAPSIPTASRLPPLCFSPEPARRSLAGGSFASAPKDSWRFPETRFGGHYEKEPAASGGRAQKRCRAPCPAQSSPHGTESPGPGCQGAWRPPSDASHPLHLLKSVTPVPAPEHLGVLALRVGASSSWISAPLCLHYPGTANPDTASSENTSPSRAVPAGLPSRSVPSAYVHLLLVLYVTFLCVYCWLFPSDTVSASKILAVHGRRQPPEQ